MASNLCSLTSKRPHGPIFKEISRINVAGIKFGFF